MIEDLYTKGLVLVNNFLDEQEELRVLSNIPETPIINKQTRNSIRRYGSKIPYKNQIESDTIPDYLDKLCDKIFDAGYLTTKPNSVSINEYLSGNSISPHIDSLESGKIITILSLLSEATMVFSMNNIKHSVNILPRSLIHY